ncbi:type IV pilus assembly protein PilM [Agaribacter marinus]|uniref:Pilus assembly protein PilM n=1 Tax=Agaribacter marinus TaxID=1431249 RepID=A0AA37WLB6_9ALTE|nr:type IV pilus assembly protein PilM [Agaribacter marinus]GLR72319.1 pilus assembly protein PilM [Agaribacter marinus]
MKSLFRKKANTIIGLDIGTKFVKAVCLDLSGATPKVMSFASEPIQGMAFAEREIKDFDAIGKALKKVNLSLKAKTKEAVIAVAGASVISKLVFMDPDQSDFELETQIELEADSLIPYPLDEVYLDFEQLRLSEAHPGKVEVLLSAAHKDMVDSRITIVREAPFDPVIVDIESNALADAVIQFGNQIEDEITVCVNMGAALMQLCVIENNEVIYIKEHSFGLNSYIQDLALIHAIDTQEVERQIADNTAPDEWFKDSLSTFIGGMQQQIQRALQMFVATSHKTMPSNFILSGGAANLPNIAEELSNDMGMQVSIFNPFKDMIFDAKVNEELLINVAPQLAIAAGLATRRLSQWHK